MSWYAAESEGKLGDWEGLWNGLGMIITLPKEVKRTDGDFGITWPDGGREKKRCGTSPYCTNR
jgi:hypothetical protein